MNRLTKMCLKALEVSKMGLIIALKGVIGFFQCHNQQFQLVK